MSLAEPADTITSTLPPQHDAYSVGNTEGDQESSSLPQEKRESCVKHFDALWFCYSPVHQMKEVYRYGNVDDCIGHWSKLYGCLKLRTKFANQVVDKPAAPPLWQLRSPEAATEFWQVCSQLREEFGHLGMQTDSAVQEDSLLDGPAQPATETSNAL